MVCVPCFLIPVILWIFHKFVRPWLSKIWSGSENYVTSNLTCPMPQKKKKKLDASDSGTVSKEQEKLDDSDSGSASKEPKMEENGHASTSIQSDHIKAE